MMDNMILYNELYTDWETEEVTYRLYFSDERTYNISRLVILIPTNYKSFNDMMSDLKNENGSYKQELWDILEETIYEYSIDLERGIDYKKVQDGWHIKLYTKNCEV